MSGQPDPKPERRERPARRRRGTATRQGSLGECWGGCGHAGTNRHHLIPKDFTKPGPDDDWNLVPLCGTGTTGCHGAFHGNPYVDASGTRRTAQTVCDEIAHRLVWDRPRLLAVMDFLATPELAYTFFRRTLKQRHVPTVSA